MSLFLSCINVLTRGRSYQYDASEATPPTDEHVAPPRWFLCLLPALRAGETLEGRLKSGM